MSNYDFEYLSQGFENNVLDLVKQEGFYHYKYMSTFEKFKEEFDDPKQELKHIIYLNANDLYGFAMSKLLLTSVFKWIDPKEFDLNKYASNSSKGFVPEVDLEYPKDLRELHSDYPLAPNKIELSREMLS